MDLSTIGKNIYNYRKQLNISQKELAERTGLSENYICRIENGYKIPAMESFIKIANVLNVPSDFLLLELIDSSCNVKFSSLSDKLSGLSLPDQEFIYTIVDSLIEKFKDK